MMRYGQYTVGGANAHKPGCSGAIMEQNLEDPYIIRKPDKRAFY